MQGQTKTTAALVVAALALLTFLVLVVVLWGKADDPGNETAWARWTFLMGGIEALAFAGAGWLFGREVHREAAATAQQKTAEAEQAKARTDAIVTYLETQSGAAAGTTRRGTIGPGDDALAQAAEFARRMRDGS